MIRDENPYLGDWESDWGGAFVMVDQLVQRQVARKEDGIGVRIIRD